MQNRRNLPAVFFVCSLGLLFITTPAYGYVDPNAAGLLSQILTPLLIAAAAGLTFLRRRVAEVLSGLWRLLRRRTDG
jgi:hypothetical protein